MFLILMMIAAASAEECLMACTRDYRPLCGTDGVTYANQCQLTSFNCLQKTSVSVAYQGACVESCNIACTMENIPVCGTDGVTYGNLCHLESDACLKKSGVAVQHAGECVVEPVCNVACTMQNIPVCATNGRTYGNLCQLESEACLTKSSIAVRHAGECVDARSTGCNIACQLIWQPVCGTDAVTYGNLCALESEACLTKNSIAVRHAGECVDARSTGCNIACQLMWQPVCGTDAVTYGNLCALESEACLKKTSVSVMHAGECAQMSTACNMACTMQNAPVCGTNAVTYGNLCQLESDACMKKSGVVVAHMGEC